MYSAPNFTLRNKRSGLKQSPIEITYEQVDQELDMWFKNEECEALARKTGFIQRSTSRLTGSGFFNLLTVEALDEPTISYEGLCDILEERNPNPQITPQALCERMNSNGAVEFLKAGLERRLKETTRPQSATMETAWLEPFLRVLLQDSTQMQIHENMADAFKGSGGNASAACVKVDYSYDVKSEKAEHIAIRQGADSDQGFAEDLAARVQKGDLVIRDLGYFCLNFFAYLTSIGAYFLSRLSFNVNVYVTADADEPIKLIQHINRFGNGGKTMEFNVFLGQKHRIPIRLGFQNWKSLFQINVLKGTRPERILCLIYGRLIVILVVQRLLALASAQAAAKQRELSFCKASQWLMRGGRLLKAFLDRQFGGLLRRMLSCMRRLLKQKRKRLSTWQLIARQVAYLDSFADVDHFVREELVQAGCA